jgi:ribonuclease HII
MLRRSNNTNIHFGTDEVGRGPLAGPVVVCSFVTFDKDTRRKILKEVFSGKLRDSKKIKKEERMQIVSTLKEFKKQKLCNWSIAEKSSLEIDRLGIVPCITACADTTIKSLLKTLLVENEIAFNFDAGIKSYLHKTGEGSLKYKIIQKPKADETILEVACASILAKVYRDELMTNIQEALTLENKDLATFGFDQNAGYGTRSHREAIATLGLTTYHRRSFCKSFL